jgi:DNA polymerase III epsilon subunit-like protein
MRLMIVVDVETSGTDPKRHSIVSIGAIEFEHPERTFYRECCVFDGAEIEAEALAVNGFTAAQVADPSKPPLEKIIGEFIAWCKDADERTLGGHNTSFDRDFLQAATDRYYLAWRFGNRVLDLHTLTWSHMVRRGDSPPTRGGRSAISFDVTLEYVGMPAEPKPHNGLTGARMEAEAFSRLLHGKPLLQEFERFPLPAHITTSTPITDQQTLF